MKRLRPRTSATPAKNGLAHPGAALLSPPARMGGRSWARWQHHVMLSNLKRKASLDSSRLGQFGVSVPRWDTVDDATVKKAQQIVRASAPPKRKVVDEWDQEYDKGKTKKVRGVKNDAWDASGNMFQAAASAKGEIWPEFC
ncbi:hypothetical protein WJX72_009471 [[Myrmecia] bisecta]|uniref:Uncharacterized protein n=1 Tax=[Myrmecia] bisecta TaxID=41462 RepID=A0AAW1P1S8_9CHLO